LPDSKEVEVSEETSLLKAAEKAGVYLNSLCGGGKGYVANVAFRSLKGK